MTRDRRTHTPPVIHQTGPDILKRHLFMLHETVYIHGSGMTNSAIEKINQEAEKLEKMIEADHE
jgi:hypothetical protein